MREKVLSKDRWAGKGSDVFPLAQLQNGGIVLQWDTQHSPRRQLRGSVQHPGVWAELGVRLMSIR